MDLLKGIFRGNRVIRIIFPSLCLISITEVSSAASTLTRRNGNHQGPITQHSIILTVDAVVAVLIYNIPYKWSQAFPVFLLPVSATLLVLIMVMECISGAVHWITFMDIQFQPSETAKMAVIIVTTFILSRGQDEDGTYPRAFKRIMMITRAIRLFIAPKNLSAATLLFGVVFLIMFIGCVSVKKLLALIGGLTSAGVIAVTPPLMMKNSDTPFLHRFGMWCAHIEEFTNDEEVSVVKFDIDEDAQIARVCTTVATSNVIGKGPGNSVQHDLLSQASLDFISVIIIEKLRLMGGVIVVFLYICLLTRMGRIAKKCDRIFPAFLTIGMALLLVSQAVFNIVVVIGLAPVTRQPLPLISKEDIPTLINYAHIGVILNVSRHTAKLEERSERNTLPIMQVETDNGDESTYNEARSTAEPTVKMLNNDAEFEQY